MKLLDTAKFYLIYDDVDFL